MYDMSTELSREPPAAVHTQLLGPGQEESFMQGDSGWGGGRVP